MRLEPQARRAGGYVHALIGNHEAMNMEGDFRYTTPAEFAAFADRNSPRRRDAYYAAQVAALQANPPASGLPVFDAAHRAAFDATHPLGWVEHWAAWSAEGVYGRWIMTHSAIIRIDDTLYLHGGIGPEFLTFDADGMNKAVLAALRHQPEAAGGPHDILWNEQGPLWYRGMAQNDEAAEGAHVAATLSRYGVRRIVLGHTKRYSMVAATLSRYGVRRIVLGHTKRYSMVISRFDGAVILTDIGVPAGCADPHGFLIKEGDVLTAVHRGHRLALGTSGAAHAAYLSAIAALDQGATSAARCTVN
jgi:hypothetical protein